MYEDCSSCFQAMGKTSFFLGKETSGASLWLIPVECTLCVINGSDHGLLTGEAGNAAKMMLILNMVQGSFMATIAEGLTLAQATGQSQQTFLDILCQGQMASTFLDQKCQSQ